MFANMKIFLSVRTLECNGFIMSKYCLVKSKKTQIQQFKSQTDKTQLSHVVEVKNTDIQ